MLHGKKFCSVLPFPFVLLIDTIIINEVNFMFQCIPTHRENIWRRFLRFAAALHEKQASREAHAELTRLFERYGNAVFRAAYACLHNKSDAEDVMQDTFLQYLRTNPVFESAEHEKAWLLRVAMNASKNRLRSAWFSRTDAIDESCPCPEDEELSFVWDAVRELPPHYREPVHLFYHEGYSTEEIASILQTRPSTVRSRLTRARAMLRDRLKEAYDFD